MNRVALILTPFLIAGSCQAGSQRPTGPPVTRPVTSPGPSPISAHFFAGTFVAYGIGVSTNPYGESTPNGIGVVTTTSAGMLAKAEVRLQNTGNEVEWLPGTKVLVEGLGPPGAKGAGWFVYDYNGGLELRGRFPIPWPVWAFDVSPDGSEVAYEPIARIKDAISGLR